jgi:sugar phosphate isomerase/epimerase
MNKLIMLLSVLFAAQISYGQRLKPKDTEDWRHKPEVVTPAKKCNAPPSDAIVLYAGKKDAVKWEQADGEPLKWKAGKALTTVKGTGYVKTKQAFGDCQLHIEWRTPKKVVGNGQERGNSGVFLMGLYEVQVLDSYNNETYYNGQAGSIYKQYAPLVNASRGPGKWQTYDIFFTAPRFSEDKLLLEPAYITVVHNGVLIQDHVQLEGPTVYKGIPAYHYHAAKLPLQLQDHGNPIQYRNIWIRELKEQDTKTPLMAKAETDPLEKNGWKLAVQAWSFNRFSFVEAVKFAKQLGLKYIEAYPGQKIGGLSEGTTHFSADAATRKKIKEILDHFGIKMIAYGVVNGKTPEEWKQIFEFAKEMGVETINTEPLFEDVPMVDSLANVYGIKVGIHDHARPTRYWQPETVLKVLEGRSKMIGAAVDNGHWMRSGIDPVDGYKILEGHLISLHIKDMNDFDNLKAHTVPIGTGMADIPGILKELKRQGFKGVMTIEYEYNWDDPLPDIRQSISYLRKTAAKIN